MRGTYHVPTVALRRCGLVLVLVWAALSVARLRGSTLALAGGGGAARLGRLAAGAAAAGVDEPPVAPPDVIVTPPDGALAPAPDVREIDPPVAPDPAPAVTVTAPPAPAVQGTGLRAGRAGGASATSAHDVVHFVDVKRGATVAYEEANSRGNQLPLISRPLGMAHWSPVTADWLEDTPWIFNPASGLLTGIRCTHQPSPWIGDYAFFDVLPVLGAGAVDMDWAAAAVLPHAGEIALTTLCNGTRCVSLQFASTKHGGIVRGVFPPGLSSLSGRGVQLRHLSELSGSQVGDRTYGVRGTARRFSNKLRDSSVLLFVALEVSVSGSGALAFSSDGSGAVSWAPGASPEDESSEMVVETRVGTSFLSYELAQLALRREAGTGLAYSALVAEGRAEWQALLGRVSANAGAEQPADEVLELKTMLYTSLYRSLLFPRQLGELGADGELVHWSPYAQASAAREPYPGPLSTDSGFWDAYITVYPLLHLVFPDLAEQVLEGWVNSLRESPVGRLSQWSSPHSVESMNGCMGDLSLAEAIVNGALGAQSTAAAYSYLRSESLERREHLALFDSLGFVPANVTHSVALSQNYYQTDWAVAQAARRLGDSSTAERLTARSRRWRELFDPSINFFRPKRDDRSFTGNPTKADSFNEFWWHDAFTEAGPWQYRFYVPHEPRGLREAYEQGAPKSRTAHPVLDGASPSTMCSRLRDMMSAPSDARSAYTFHEMNELRDQAFGQYAHGNQPSHHILYMFAHAGCPLEGQRWLQYTLRALYGPQGFAGDEDNGEMSAWYVLSSIGLFALAPGSGTYQIGAAPLFRSVTIQRPERLESGRKMGTLRIEREQSLPLLEDARESGFVPARRAMWRGRTIPLDSQEDDAPSIRYSELLAGGTLSFAAT
jgi:predicted alpha-1,2-mannosidase